MKPIRTIIVDDEAKIGKGLERLVQAYGEPFEVAAVLADGLEALRYMQEHGDEIDLVITDVKMPEMDGVKFVQEARKISSFAPLFISGYDDFEYLRAAMREGAVDYLLKPVDREQFRARLAEIRESIETKRRERYTLDDMRKKAEQLKLTRQTQMLSNVTMAEVDWSRLGYWVDEFPAGCFMLVYISLDALPYKAKAYSDRDWQAYSYALENIIGELVSEAAVGRSEYRWWWRAESDFWLLLHEEDPMNDTTFRAEVLRLAEQIRSAVQRFTPFTVTVSIGELIEDLYLLRNAKHKALELMNYRLILGGNRVVTAEIATGAGKTSPAKVDAVYYQMVNKLKASLQQGKRAEVQEWQAQLFAQIGKLSSPAQIQWVLQYLYMQLHALWMEVTDGRNTSLSLEKALHGVKTAANLGEIKLAVTRWIRHIEYTIHVNRISERVKPVEQAKAWIADHLGEDITIKKIADHVYMNPTYFCKCFKMHTGETVLDYVTRQRMEQAASLLRERDLKLKEISAMVGYQDAKYFSKLFKEWSGMSPSDYRNQIARASEAADE